MKRSLSHERTKMELTEYLSAKMIQRSECMGKNVIVAWGCNCQGTHLDVVQLRSSQEEADTKIILQAVDAASRGATETRPCARVDLRPGGFSCCIKLDGLSNLKYC